MPYGKGQVGLIGVHPEADASWYADWNGSNPQGIKVGALLPRTSPE
jgi:hypothetical protein